MIKILHVEDDADIREIALMALSLSGDFDVTQCESGEDAIKAVAHLQPDLFLLDVMMPGLTGPETLEHFRKDPSLSEVPVIFMTARAQSNDVEWLYQLGAAQVISKPFDPLTLSTQIMTTMQMCHPRIAV
ncbi:response regulator [Roseovarius aestuarii]|nr:response regulator [Roseovarius aestuarii]